MNRLIARRSLLDDLFQGAAPVFHVTPASGNPLPKQIRIDVRETPEAYAVDAEVPGVSRDDIQVTIEGDVVTLRAEVKREDRVADGEKLLRNERYHGAVSRSFQLPQDVDNTAARAKYESGVLRLTLPKKAASVSQRIAIE